MLFYLICISDQNERTEAQSFLEQAAQSSFSQFLAQLCEVLAGANHSKVARTAAGLQVLYLK